MENINTSFTMDNINTIITVIMIIIVTAILIDGLIKAMKCHKQIHDETHHVFDDSNCHWVDNVEFNEFFVQDTIDSLEASLKTRGFITLNHALNTFGLKTVCCGDNVGWIYSKSPAIDITWRRFEDGSPDLGLSFNVYQGYIDDEYDFK